MIQSGRNEVRIYVKKRYWEKLRPLVGREVRILLLVDSDEGT